MAEEMGLVLNLLPKLNKAQMDMVKAQINAQMAQVKAVEVIKGKPGSYAAREAQLRAEMANVKALKMGLPGVGEAEIKKPGLDLTKAIQPLIKGDIFGGLKGILGAGAVGGVTGGMMIGIMDGIKSAVTKIWDLFRQSSPILQRSLKMIQLGIMGMIRPFADTLGRLLYPITRFFMLWGRAIYQDYREKYKKYVGEGMSPIEASIRASVESFIDGIVGLFTGAVGGIDLGSSIITIIDSIVSAFLKAVSNPSTMAGILLIGGMIVGAVGVALLLAAGTFLVSMNMIAALITAAAGTGLISAAPAFLTASGLIAGAFGAAALLGMAGLALGIALTVEYAADWLRNWLKNYLGLKGWEPPPAGGPAETPEQKRLRDLWNLPLPSPFQHGGIVTKPTMGIIGEAGPEAVVPLSKMGNLGGKSITIGSINISGNFNKDIDLERAIQNALDDYMRTYRGR